MGLGPAGILAPWSGQLIRGATIIQSPRCYIFSLWYAAKSGWQVCFLVFLVFYLPVWM